MPPIYERRCRRCRKVYSKLCRVEHRNEPDKCPSCACPDTDPIMSATRTNFKFADRSPFK